MPGSWNLAQRVAVIFIPPPFFFAGLTSDPNDIAPCRDFYDFHEGARAHAAVCGRRLWPTPYSGTATPLSLPFSRSDPCACVCIRDGEEEGLEGWFLTTIGIFCSPIVLPTSLVWGSSPSFISRNLPRFPEPPRLSSNHGSVLDASGACSWSLLPLLVPFLTDRDHSAAQFCDDQRFRQRTFPSKSVCGSACHRTYTCANVWLSRSWLMPPNSIARAICGYRRMPLSDASNWRSAFICVFAFAHKPLDLGR